MALKASDFVPDKIKTTHKKAKQAFQTFVRLEVEAAKANAQLMAMNFTGGFVTNNQTVRGIKSNMRSIEKLGKKIEDGDPVLTDKDYKARVDIYSLIVRKHAPEAVRLLDQFDKLLADAEKETKTRFGVLRKKSAEVRQQAETASKDAKADQDHLQRWWQTLSKDGMTAIPVDSRNTDILEKTPKNLDINMPDQQPFSATVRFSNVPKFLEADFRNDGSRHLQKAAKEKLKPVKVEIGQQFGKFNTAFQAADKTSDNKRAKAIFDNINDYLKKDIKPKLESALQEAADDTVAELRKNKLYRPLFDKSGTGVGRVDVDTKDFFSVRFVEKADPSADLVSGFTDASKSLAKHQSAYEGALKELTRNLKTVEENVTELGSRITALKSDIDGRSNKDFDVAIKAESSKRERLLEQIGVADKGINSQADTMNKSLDELSKKIAAVSSDFENKAGGVKDNINVSKKSVENYRAAVKAFEAAVAKARKFEAPKLGWKEKRGPLTQYLVAGSIRKQKLNDKTLAKELDAQKMVLATLENATSVTTVAITKEYKAVEKAAAALA